MKQKKVLVHGTDESLKEFFAEKLSKIKYNCLATLNDSNKNNLPSFVYQLIDGVVLTNKPTRTADIEYFKKLIEPRKIICWNPNGYIEHFVEKADDGGEIYYAEGLEFHVRNEDDDRNFRNNRYNLYKQNQFYLMDKKDLPEKIAKYYEDTMKKPLDWNNLRTWTEKMQWIRTYDNTPIKTRLADKFLVRQWIADKIGDEYLIPLYGVWDNFDEIDFDALPNQFVLKTNHGSAMNIICRDKNNFDIESAREKINTWLAIDYGTLYFEPLYNNIPKKIIAEKFMKDGENLDLVDYKFFCFHGEPKYCQVETDRSNNWFIDFFDMNWKHADFERPDHLNNDHPEDIQKPEHFELMKKLAAELCKDFIHVRVDFYEIEGKIYFGEMTFTPGLINDKFKPEGTDELLGVWTKLPTERR